jgi:hypothetical protein
LRASKISRIVVGVGTPEPKTVTTHHGGPTVAFQLRDSQQVTLSVEALDAEGNPANVTTAWSSSDTSIASVTDGGDGTALVVASPEADGLGTTTIKVTVTDNSDGDVHEGTFEVEVIAGDAVTVNISAGTPEDKPAV